MGNPLSMVSWRVKTLYKDQMGDFSLPCLITRGRRYMEMNGYDIFMSWIWVNIIVMCLRVSVFVHIYFSVRIVDMLAYMHIAYDMGYLIYIYITYIYKYTYFSVRAIFYLYLLLKLTHDCMFLHRCKSNTKPAFLAFTEGAGQVHGQGDHFKHQRFSVDGRRGVLGSSRLPSYLF